MNEITIACPSKGRPDKVLTNKVVDKVVLVVNENEKEEYEKYNSNNEVVSPPKHVNNLSKTRDWIINKYDNVVMMDDDIDTVRINYAETREKIKITDPKQVYDIILYTANIAKQLGTYMFGFSNIRNPVGYRSASPFKFVEFMPGATVGFLKGHGMYYDPRIETADDYFVTCLNAYYHRYSLINTMFTFLTVGNFTREGGVMENRTQKVVVNDTMILRETFGEIIQIKKPTHLKKHLHYGERSLLFPY